MKNKHLIAIMALLSAGSTFGAPLTPEQALRRVATDSRAPQKARRMAPQARLVRTIKADNKPGIYLYESGGTMLALAADDIARPLLAYFEASENHQESAPAMEYWLSTLASEIDFYAKKGISSFKNVALKAQDERKAITPWLKTTWNQDAPYNDKCPMINGSRSVTGCVATAMSQLINYYKYPSHGDGSNSYTWNNTTLSFDYSNTTFDWENMLDSYSGDYTQAQGEAVATLMLAAGVSVNMDYSSTASGASSSYIPAALIKHFNYDKGVHLEEREYYTTAEWTQLVYDNVSRGPVIYDGQSNQGGHSFVCDGYDGNGFFHFNWGWAGMSDGYFALSALDPIQQGIGGSTSGFNYMQDIVADAKPDDGGGYHYMMQMPEGFYVENQGNNNLEVGNLIWNMSLCTISGNYGLKAVDKAGETIYLEGSSFNSRPYLYGDPSYKVKVPSSMADGEYVITPIFCVANGKWINIQVDCMLPVQAYMTIKDGSVTDIKEGSSAIIEAYGLTTNSPIVNTSYFNVKGTLKNISDKEFYGPCFYGVLKDEDNQYNMYAISDFVTVSLEAGETREFDDVTRLSRVNSNTDISIKSLVGDYKLALLTISGEQFVLLSEPVDVSLIAQPATTLSTQSLTIVGDSENVDKDKMEFVASMMLEEGYFFDYLTLYIFPKLGAYSQGSLQTDFFKLEVGKLTDVHFSGAFPAGKEGETYRAYVYWNNRQIGNHCTFTIASGSGVESIEEEAATYEYYNTLGMRVTDHNLVKGQIYIRISRDASGRRMRSDKIIY